MRTMLVTLGVLSTAVVVAACGRQAGTAELTSASITTVSPADPGALRLADELCGRAVACREVGDGARYRSEEACQSDQGARAPAQATRWSCRARPGLDRCLAAVRAEHCETTLTSVEQLTECRDAAVCGGGQ